MDNLLEELRRLATGGVLNSRGPIGVAEAQAIADRAMRHITYLEERVRLYESGQLTGPTYLAEQTRHGLHDG